MQLAKLVWFFSISRRFELRTVKWIAKTLNFTQEFCFLKISTNPCRGGLPDPPGRHRPGIGCIKRKKNVFSIFCNTCYSYLSPAAMPHAPIQGRMHQTVAWWHQIRLFVLRFVSTQSYVFFGPVDSYSNFINSFMRFFDAVFARTIHHSNKYWTTLQLNIFQILRERCVLQLWWLAAPLDPALPFHIAVAPARILGISEASRH